MLFKKKIKFKYIHRIFVHCHKSNAACILQKRVVLSKLALPTRTRFAIERTKRSRVTGYENHFEVGSQWQANVHELSLIHI